MTHKMKFKKGDQALVITGKDKGKKGEVVKVLPADNKVIISGVNVVTKHQKPSQFSQGGLIKKEMPIHVSNISHFDPDTGKAHKVGFKVTGESKERVLRGVNKVLGQKEGK